MNKYSLAIESRAKAVRTCREKWKVDNDSTITAATQKLMADRMAAVLGQCPVYYWTDELLKVVEQAAIALEATATTDNIATTISVASRPSTSGYYFFEKSRPTSYVGDMEGLAWLSTKELIPSNPNLSDDKVVVSAITQDDSGFSVYAKELNRDPDDWNEGQAFLARLLAASWAFLDQTILVSEPTPIDRHVQRRNKHTANNLNVIYLRRVRNHKTETNQEQTAPTRSIEYTCRWLVRGHWRNQYYPSLKQHKTRWILPYPKGPDDKPLKIKPSVIAVVR